jgi:hypothetical protein
MFPILAMGAASLAGSFLNNRSQNRAATTAGNAQVEAARVAADAARFRPVNVSTGLSSSQFQTDPQGNVTGATSQIDPRLGIIQDQNLVGASDMFQQGGVDVNQAQQDYWNNYLQRARPEQNNMFSQLQNRLGAQGLLGLNAGTDGAAGPGQGNPFYSQFSRGVSDSDAAQWANSFQFGNQLADTQLARGNNMLSTAFGIDNLGRQSIDLGGVLGGRATSGATAGAGYMANAGANAATLVQQARSGGYDVNNAALQRMITNLAPRIQNQGQAASRADYGNMYDNVGW